MRRQRGAAEPVGFSAGAQVEVREEQWLVRKVEKTARDGFRIEVTGISPFVRDTEAVFYSCLDDIRPLDPRRTKLVADDSPNHRRARLYLEAVIRKTHLPQTEHGLALAGNFLMDHQLHQLRPAELALSMKNAQPRVLIADVVGLGKTLEIGVLLAELIRRGRGERILVVSPQHVLEQFQREMWTRFAIPLVRLDSAGVQRMQQEIPAGRNPFAYFKRAIISIDTLKNKNLYGHYLENTKWDAVVIDESHNLVNRGSERNELARLLAPRTDALLLASATPHNGDPRSFAELIKLLDPAAIADPTDYRVDDLDHLYLRRTKTSPEVRDSLKGSWADRGPSTPIHVQASAKEDAVFEALARDWIPRDGSGESAGSHQLTGYNLFKKFLSSHKALLSTITSSQQRFKYRKRPPKPAEVEALQRLHDLAAQITDDDSAKLRALIDQLRDLNVGPDSDTRVVVFSESIPTLTWLAEAVPPALGFTKDGSVDDKKPWLAYGHQGRGGAIQVMHGDANTDQEQMEIVERFGLRDDPVRILFTGDIASEGVNLHQHCSQLVHFDLPWSLIRIEQRNGRIDRYGQQVSPEFRALVLVSAVPWRTDPRTGEPRSLDDRLVGEKLLKREEEAHKIEGSAEAAAGTDRAKDEEDRLTRDLIAGKTVEQSLVDAKQGVTGFLSNLLGQVGAVPEHKDVPHAVIPRLFDSTAAYFEEALRQVTRTDPADELSLRHEDDGTIAFEPPRDLLYRLRALPKSYLDEQRILPTDQRPGRILVTFDKRLADRRLKAARDSSTSQWPNVSYLTDVHPVLDWITDKVLVEVGYHEAPVLAADVEGPIYLIQGTYSNALGRPTVLEWMAVRGLPGAPEVTAMDNAFLEECGVGARMPGRSVPLDRDLLQAHVPAAVDAARDYLKAREAEYQDRTAAALEPYRKRVTHWQQEALFAGSRPNKQQVRKTAGQQFDLIRKLETAGEPMLRLLAVLEGGGER
ncbi:helicase [Mangrovactinospora gilvigrisea]|uniref:Helicase n=1 Tax=Mangrovactinospora gilvigrisea TaxID=1428644 RepID=A0A1J7BGV3_9ACTN|nr:helicase [Mangrovactinospora gilvigrisea]